MCTARIKERISSASVLGPAWLPNWTLVCNKLGRDGSAKANIVSRKNAVVHGVIYTLNMEDLETLDRIEGGYRRETMQVYSAALDSVKVETYVAIQLTANPIPFGWYKDYILAGASEHELPAEYLNFLDQLPVIEK